MSQNMFTAQWTQTQNFYAYIDNNGNIISQTFQGNQVVGVTTAKYKQLEQLATEATDKAESYKKQLIDAGLLVEPLSEKEQIAQLSQQVAQLTQIIQSMGANNYEYSKHNLNGIDNAAEQQSQRQDSSSTANGESIPQFKGRSVPANAKTQPSGVGLTKSIGNAKDTNDK